VDNSSGISPLYLAAAFLILSVLMTLGMARWFRVQKDLNERDERLREADTLHDNSTDIVPGGRNSDKDSHK